MPSDTEHNNNYELCLHMSKPESGSEEFAGLSHKLEPGEFVILHTVFCSSPDLTFCRTTHCRLRHFLTGPARHFRHALLSLGVQITNSSLLRLAFFAASVLLFHDFSSSRLMPLRLYVHVIGYDDVDAMSSPPPRNGSVSRETIEASLDEVESYDEALENCRVCLEEMSPRESRVARMPCSHMFHTDCIVKWLVISLSCPICRHKLPI